MTGKSSCLNRKVITLLVSHTLTSAVFAGGLEAADDAFREGRFGEAELLYSDVVDATGKPYEAVTIPYWMAGDHFMVAQGRVNGGEPRMLFVDTGLAGGGFLCPDSMIQEAKIALGNTTFDGVGGAGTVKVTPFMVNELSLGGVLQRDIPSFAGAFPNTLENRFGFRIAGIVSHSFFRPYSVTFDSMAMRMYVAKGTTPNP